MNGGEPNGIPFVRLELAPSWRLAAAILAVHLGGAACCLAVLPDWHGIALAVLLPALGVWAARDRALLRGAHAARAIEIGRSGEALLVLADGQTSAIRPVGGIGVNRHWVALNCAAPGRRGFLVTAGMLGPGAFRLLRLWALWGKVPDQASRQVTA